MIFTQEAPLTEVVFREVLYPDRIGIWKVLVFAERGKPEYPEKNLSEQSREPTTNSTHRYYYYVD